MLKITQIVPITINAEPLISSERITFLLSPITKRFNKLPNNGLAEEIANTTEAIAKGIANARLRDMNPPVMSIDAMITDTITIPPDKVEKSLSLLGQNKEASKVVQLATKMKSRVETLVS